MKNTSSLLFRRKTAGKQDVQEEVRQYKLQTCVTIRVQKVEKGLSFELVSVLLLYTTEDKSVHSKLWLKSLNHCLQMGQRNQQRSTQVNHDEQQNLTLHILHFPLKSVVPEKKTNRAAVVITSGWENTATERVQKYVTEYFELLKGIQTSKKKKTTLAICLFGICTNKAITGRTLEPHAVDVHSHKDTEEEVGQTGAEIWSVLHKSSRPVLHYRKGKSWASVALYLLPKLQMIPIPYRWLLRYVNVVNLFKKGGKHPFMFND